MRKATYIIVCIIILVGIIVVGVHLFTKSMQIATYKSPDGHYELIIKYDRSIFFSTMPGDGGNPEVEVILKNANGTIIGTSNSNNNCGIFNDSIEVKWDIENEEVWYGKSKTINLKTGKVTC